MLGTIFLFFYITISFFGRCYPSSLRTFGCILLVFQCEVEAVMVPPLLGVVGVKSNFSELEDNQSLFTFCAT